MAANPVRSLKRFSRRAASCSLDCVHISATLLVVLLKKECSSQTKYQIAASLPCSRAAVCRNGQTRLHIVSCRWFNNKKQHARRKLQWEQSLEHDSRKDFYIESLNPEEQQRYHEAHNTDF